MTASKSSHEEKDPLAGLEESNCLRHCTNNQINMLSGHQSFVFPFFELDGILWTKGSGVFSKISAHQTSWTDANCGKTQAQVVKNPGR
jgi:hypothetical protein